MVLKALIRIQKFKIELKALNIKAHFKQKLKVEIKF